jgi:2-iminobutanoate/2-iminopropanoate deaminase
MQRQMIATPKAPAAIGPYSQAVRVGDLVFTAGQIPLDPATGQLVAGGIEAQTRQALTNLSAVLEAAGTSLANAVKTTVFLADMAEFKAMNGVYAEFFPAAPPARSTVQVAGLPLDARVEIEVVAVIS